MVLSVQQIKFEIMRYVRELGSDFSQWHIGISDNPSEALFITHKVDQQRGVWMYKQAVSVRACHTVRDYFLNIQNMSGSAELEETLDGSNNYIFLYKKVHDHKSN
jgi:hypothetical protein